MASQYGETQRIWRKKMSAWRNSAAAAAAAMAKKYGAGNIRCNMCHLGINIQHQYLSAIISVSQ
jgi:hypothetical protein